jgi:hypothetical protein
VLAPLFMMSLFDLHDFRRVTTTTGLPLPTTSSSTGVSKPKKKEKFLAPKVTESSEQGWSTIHVFTGDDKHVLDASAIPPDAYFDRSWFSQRLQDKIVFHLLNQKKNGYFVDLAANDAVRISNTFALERDHGWRGLCIEPNPIYWAGLSYRKCDVVAGVVGRTRMEEVLFKFSSKGPLGGIVGAHFKNKEVNEREQAVHEAQRRYTVTLQEVFERFHTPPVIDYMSLDVEGAEEYVMSTFPFDRYRINVLTIEGPSKALQTRLRMYKYVQLATLSRREETLWVHKDIIDAVNASAIVIDIPRYTELVPPPPSQAQHTGRGMISPEYAHLVR